MESHENQGRQVVEIEEWLFPDGVTFILFAIAILIANVVVFLSVLSSPHLRGQRSHLLVLNISAADLMFAAVLSFGAGDYIAGVPAPSCLGWYAGNVYVTFVWPAVTSLHVFALNWSSIARLRSARSSYQETARFTGVLAATPWVYAFSVVVPVVVLLSPFDEKTGHVAPPKNLYNVFLSFALPSLLSLISLVTVVRVRADVQAKRAIYEEITGSLHGEAPLWAITKGEKPAAAIAAANLSKAELAYVFLSTCLGVLSVLGWSMELPLVFYTLRALLAPCVWMARSDCRDHVLALPRSLCCSPD